MRLLNRLFVILFLSLSFVVNSFAALEFSSAPTLEEAGTDFLKINWEDIPEAIGYYVSYSETSGLSNGYDYDLPDFLDENQATINDLDIGTEYFISIIAVNESGEESPFSPEANFETLGQANVDNSLGLLKVTPIGENIIELEFNVDFTDDESYKDFKVINKSTGAEIYAVEAVIKEETNNTLQVILESALDDGVEYQLEILELTDSSGANVENIVESGDMFMVGSVEEVVVEEVEPVIEEVEPVVEEVEAEVDELNSAGHEGNAGSEVSDEVLNSNVDAAKDNATEMPTTGAEHWLIMILAVFIAAFVFLMRKSKA